MNIEIGSIVFASNQSKKMAEKNGIKHIYIGIDPEQSDVKKHIVKNKETGDLGAYKYVTEVKVSPWGLSDCPTPPFTVVDKLTGEYKTVNSLAVVTLGFVVKKNHISLSTLCNDYSYIPNRSSRRTVRLFMQGSNNFWRNIHNARYINVQQRVMQAGKSV